MESIQIIDMDAEDVNESIVYESADVTSDVVQIEPGTGRYECKVTNSLGTTTKFIVLHPQGTFNRFQLPVLNGDSVLLVRIKTENLTLKRLSSIEIVNYSLSNAITPSQY